jgi:hypothetical protein
VSYVILNLQTVYCKREEDPYVNLTPRRRGGRIQEERSKGKEF